MAPGAKIIDTITELRNFRGQWDSIVERSGSDTWFMGWDWLDTWWSCFGDSRYMFVIVLSNREGIYGLAPLCIEVKNIAGMVTRKLQFIGGADSDYADFVLAGSRFDGLSAIGDFLHRHHHLWDWAEFLHIPEDSPNWGPLREAILKKNWFFATTEFWSISPYVSIQRKFSDYFRKLRKKHRGDVSRQEKRLQRMGHVSLVRLNSSSTDLERHFENFWKMRKARLKDAGRKGYNSFQENRYKRFYWKLINGSAVSDHVHFSSLSCGGIPVAYHFGFVSEDRFYYYTPTFDPNFQRYSPGKVMVKYLIKWAFEQKLDEFDFLLGDEPYKLHWTDNVRRVYNVYLFPRNTKGFLLYLMVGKLKLALRKRPWAVSFWSKLRADRT